MPEKDEPRAEGPVPLPFSRPVEPGELSREAERPVDIALAPEEEAALARALDVVAVSGVRLEGRIAPWRAEGWEFAGRLLARVEQRCVVTLEPVVTPLEIAVERRWSPDAASRMPEAGAHGADLAALEAAAEGPDPLGERIELAELVLETLALAIDPYPRAGDVAFGSRVAGPPGAEPLTDEAARPFAGLAALRRRLEDGD